MAKDKINSMKAGYKLDSAIEKFVFRNSDIPPRTNYSTSNAGAFEVVEELSYLGEYGTVWVKINSPYRNQSNRVWTVKIYEGSVELVCVKDEDFCVAACKVALLFVHFQIN
jgi:hypothetical protein